MCAGKHVAGRSALVSLRLLPALLAVARAEDLDPLEQALVDALRDQGPLTAPELARVTGRERRRLGSSLDRLQRKLVVTGAGAQERSRGWNAVVLDLVDRRYEDALRVVPGREEARRQLADAVVRQAREVSAADLAAVLRCRVGEASAALDQLVEEGAARRREEEGFAIWTARGRP